jgi:hypothetical protein
VVWRDSPTAKSRGKKQLSPRATRWGTRLGPPVRQRLSCLFFTVSRAHRLAPVVEHFLPPLLVLVPPNWLLSLSWRAAYKSRQPSFLPRVVLVEEEAFVRLLHLPSRWWRLGRGRGRRRETLAGEQRKRDDGDGRS